MPNGGNLDCRGEVSQQGSRTDIRWIYRGGNSVDIAVLEFKNTRALHWHDFEPAMTDVNGARVLRDGAQAKASKTLFTGNAYWLSKQAKKYSSLGIPDVALFDWDAMFIFDFHDMNEDALNPVLARGIWFTEAGKDHSQGQTFRMALYGFLIRALRRHQVIP